MTFTIGAVLIKFLEGVIVGLLVGLPVGMAFMKRKAAQGFTTVDAAAKAELKALETSIRTESLAAMNDKLAKARKEFKELI